MTAEYILKIKFDEDFPEKLKNFYTEYENKSHDSGIDLVIPEDIIVQNDTFKPTTINHKISCQMVLVDSLTGDHIPVGYWLLPRSSISKTPFRMANSVGLIDSGYRGNIMAKVDLIDKEKCHEISRGTRMFQIATGDLTPIYRVEIVNELPESHRGTGGFGSTGTTGLKLK